MRRQAIVLATALAVTMPLGVRAADLVVSWQKAHHPREDEALAEIIAAFEQDTGKQVEVTLLAMAEQPPQIEAALEANRPPDVAFGFWLSSYIPEWALEDRLVDLTDTVGSFSNMFDPAQLNRAMLLNAKTGQKAL